MRRNVHTNTAVETASQYEINGSKYKVHSHFAGEKDIDDVINNIATAKALSDVLISAA